MEMVETKLRPGLHLLTSGLELLNRNKLNLGDDLFVFLYLFRRTKQYMHHPKMNPTDLGGIVVDQANRSCVEGSLNREFFAYLSFDSILKRLQADGKKRMVFIIDVAADANGSFGNQTLFAGLLATNIMKNALSVSDHHIGDDLFEIRIRLCLGAGLKTVVLLIKDYWQIAINLGSETLKKAKLLKNRTGKNENFFVCNRHKLSDLPFQRPPRKGSFSVTHAGAFLQRLLPAEQFAEWIRIFHAPKNTGAGSRG